MSMILATTYHDPHDGLYDQMRRVLPIVYRMFTGIVVVASPTLSARADQLLEAAGVVIIRAQVTDPSGIFSVGRQRRLAIQRALQTFPEAQTIMYCDWDRALHWAEYVPTELARMTTASDHHDFVVLGRTARAFATHPRVQRDTESLINRVYALLSANDWDVTAAARLLSRRAAEAILVGCPDEGISTDVTWPLFLQRNGPFLLDYRETEGLEFETADRYPADIAAAGGREFWIAALDADPHQWLLRLRLALHEIEAAMAMGGTGERAE